MNVDRINQLVADDLKTLANTIRLRILLALLNDSSLRVSAMAEQLGVAHAHLSVYLNKMKDRGTLSATQQGTSIYYSLKNPVLITELMQILNRLA